MPAHSSTSYDEGLEGLHVAYYANPNLAGQPKMFSLGLVGGTGTTAGRDWNAGSPDSTLPNNGFSLRMTGTITFPVGGTVTLKTLAEGGTRVWLDDVLVVSNWTEGASTLVGNSPITVTALITDL